MSMLTTIIVISIYGLITEEQAMRGLQKQLKLAEKKLLESESDIEMAEIWTTQRLEQYLEKARQALEVKLE